MLLEHTGRTSGLPRETVLEVIRHDERAVDEPIWTKLKADYPAFAEYEQKTDRIIPVVMLDPV